MFENIKKNKFQSGLIIGIFILVITLIVYYICNALRLGTISIVIALIFSIASAWGSYYYSDKIVLSLNKARPATKEEDLKLVNILDSLMVASGLTTKPRLYVVEDAQPNAFATGRNPENAVICVTTGLLEKLDYYELEGVIAHEMSHIKNYDIRLSCVVSVMVGFIVMLSDMFSRMLFLGGIKDRDNDNSKGNGILMIIGLICLILSPIFGSLMQLALSRKREFLADSTAVEFTRNPDGLISALEKLENDPNQLETANSATANMYIVNPFKKDTKEGKKKTSSIWSTHPSTEDRIEALRNIK
ncbi:MAG: M48 family metallopeptidase [Clostridia bacterium]